MNDLYGHLYKLAEKFGVYDRFVNDCIQEMAIKYLEGKTNENDLKKVCIDFGYRSKRNTPCSDVLENVLFTEDGYEETNNDYVMGLLAKATEQGIISLDQANILYQWLLGDADVMIAKQMKKERSTITWHRNKAIRLLRDHFEVVS